MTKVVINGCFGGFGLSIKAQVEILHRKGKNAFVYQEMRNPDYRSTRVYQKVDFDSSLKEYDCYVLDTDLGNFVKWDEKFSEALFDSRPDKRDDPDLVAIVEKLGDKADGYCAKLHVVEIPDDAEWEIDEYDGNESVEEVHRSWR